MYIETYYLFIINIVIFFIGYVLGKISIKIVANNKSALSSGKLSSNNAIKNTIQIDEKKIITKIDTTELEKKYDELGEVTTSSVNISNSIDRLKKLKSN